MKYYYGIDLGGTSIKIGFFDQNINRIHSYSVVTPREGNVLKVIHSEIVNDMRRRGIVLEDVKAIGVAVPGPVCKGVIVKLPNVNLEPNIDAQKILENLFENKVAVIVVNDASAAAYGEYMVMSQKVLNVVFYTLGTGVGGGIIINGNLLEGSNGFASEIGHMIVIPGMNEICGCGKSGCLEQMVGINYLVKYYKELTGDEEDITVKDIFDLAKQGVVSAIKVVDRLSYYIAISAVNLAVILEPNAFIIGGGISNAGDYLIDKIRGYYLENSRFNTKEIPFLLASLGNDAGMVGAAFIAKDNEKKD